MSSFYYLLVLLYCFIFPFPHSDANCAGNQPVRLLSATEQKWTPGVQSGGGGTEYYFSIKIVSAKTIVFDSVWIGDQVFSSFVTRQKASITGESFLYQKGDTVVVRVSALKNRIHKETISKPLTKCKGPALIGYLINGKRKYICVEKITQKPAIHLP